MADNEKEDGEKKPKGTLFNLSSLIPEVEHDGTTYISTVTSTDSWAKLRKELAADEDMSAEDFSARVVLHSIRPKDSEDQVDEELARSLASNDGFLEKLILAHPELYSKIDRSESGDKPKRVELLERGEDESAAAFLLRAFRDHDERRVAQTKAFTERMTREFQGLAGSLSGKGLDALIRGNSASDRIKDIIEGSHSSLIDKALGRSAYGADTFTAPEPMRLPPMPENPIHETNRKLAKMATSTEEMRQVIFQQAEMQRSLNEVATELLDKFVEGSATAERNAKRAIGVAVAAVLVAVATFIIGQLTNKAPEEMVAQQGEVVSTLHEIRDYARASDEAAAEQDQQMIESLDKIEEQTANPTRPSR
ncbi:hypothetical protein GRI43_13640 [Altererythrobacter luteolus]|uniref:Uncharacterized protein n=1 Tax=Pontixanthobacter luteolus TaxID=295089 RepID=A0A6I4V4Z8_9SPHN|nr:hypothetical protein [Pontixanthobacter luteolus]MXP48431.1 hypothetical protein [Pontixanthobacter luteolus]